MTEGLTKERMNELEEFGAGIFSAYFKGKERYGLTDEEFAEIAAGAIGKIAAENDIKNGNHAATKIIFLALRVMLSFTNPDLISQMMRDRLSATTRERST